MSEGEQVARQYRAGIDRYLDAIELLGIPIQVNGEKMSVKYFREHVLGDRDARRRGTDYGK